MCCEGLFELFFPTETSMKIGVLVLCTALIFALSLSVGTSSIDFFVWHDWIFTVRLPRIILAALAGSGLAAAGVCFQALLHNPLADPYVVGVSGGAALGGVLAIVLGITHIPAAAFVGGFLSVLLLFWVARASGHADPLTLLLLGVVFNAFASAVVTVIKTLVSATKAQEILFWLLGNIDVQPPQMLWILAIYVFVGLVLLQLLSGALNLLSLGDEHAYALGLPVTAARLLAFATGALLVGSVVSVCGMLGFVGLVVPHLMRQWVGNNHRILLPAAALAGASFLIVADTLARLTFLWFGTEIPTGAVTAFAGGPFFLVLLLRQQRLTT
jgi:iron complex transport system permease protein